MIDGHSSSGKSFPPWEGQPATAPLPAGSGELTRCRGSTRGERIHIAIYLKHFPAAGAPLSAGTSLAVDGLAAGLVQSGADVTVLCEGTARSTVTVAAGYTIECFANGKPYRTFSLAPELRRYARERLVNSNDLCLVNGIFHPAVYAMGQLLYRLDVPYVVVPHGAYNPAIFRKNAHLKWPYWYLFERRLLRRARAVQVLDIRYAACLRRLGIDTPCFETPNGVAPDTVPEESELQWRLHEEPVRVMFLGRIDAHTKGLDLLLAAFARVSGQVNMKLTVQGPDWGDRAQLEKQASNAKLTNRIEFREAEYGRSAQIIGEHDIFCLPSRFEGFGLAALEAMLAGRVLLASDGAGIARHVSASHCGLTVPPTVEGIEEGLHALLRLRPAWREMGLNGRRYALAKLQWKNIGAAALERYEELLV